ncbi:U1 small nuclear ribonucleoprotein C [Apostasia shenzhenica]|uniref:U1 small nuclear ribonucleoprotein C n=1 Tax=Apostasia shenzhenica TaxID=1088818 RepID=A0A2I0B0E6_9ASPA|nr:U1 small nuclear ribonucleoprotein C [Apostasia shenzhenica]
MPRYYCDYCDTYLTHDSPSVRKQHNAGYKHKANVRTYYQQFEEQQTQSLIDQRIKEHLGQAAAFQHQVGATFNQHLMSLQANPQRPRLPIIPPPILPLGAAPGQISAPLIPGMRPPVLPRPITGAPGYPGIAVIPPSLPPPGAVSMPMQMNNLPMPPTLIPPASGVATAQTPNGAPAIYQVNPSFTSSAPAAPSVTAPEDGFSYAQALETSQ